MRRLLSYPFIAVLLCYANSALAKREATPEAIAYWRANGPYWVFAAGIVSVLIVLFIAWTLAIRAKRR
ncbi:hypothetical protein [Carnimonas nigrificans]|uniref:hypothetical protein n=1 Tax=Carnimonas nigrificans TaxID=64323 RepID=UPI000472DEE4|nr:hypothetical protein [Carnimonas nigrificans]